MAPNKKKKVEAPTAQYRKELLKFRNMLITHKEKSGNLESCINTFLSLLGILAIILLPVPHFIGIFFIITIISLILQWSFEEEAVDFIIDEIDVRCEDSDYDAGEVKWNRYTAILGHTAVGSLIIGIILLSFAIL